MIDLGNPLSRGAVPGVRLRVLSLGAGMQSSTLAMMAARGEIGPMPDAGIFADTGAEPRAVYRWLDWLEPQLPFRVYRVTAGDFAADLLRASDINSRPGVPLMSRVSSPPLFTKGPTGGMGMISRQCTRDYKIIPIRRKLRELAGLKRGQRGGKTPIIEQWIGISLDEMVRIKEAREAYIANRWPLIERRMSRRQCEQWWDAEWELWTPENRPPTKRPPRSACKWCPYHDDEEWLAIKAVPEDWADAVQVDNAMRSGLRKVDHELFVHKSCVPLAEADLTGGKDPSQISMLDECEGMCGV